MYEIVFVLVISCLILAILHRQLNWQDADLWQARKAQRIQYLWSLAQKKIRENDFLEAEKTLLTILTFNPKNAPAYNRLGILYAKQKEYGDAITCFTAAFDIQQNASSLHNLGLVYYNLEQYEKASIALKEAIELDNQSAMRYIEYSRVLERLGRQGEMLQALEKAAELDASPVILKFLLKAYKARKMEDKADALQEQIDNMITSSGQQHSPNQATT